MGNTLEDQVMFIISDDIWLQWYYNQSYVLEDSLYINNEIIDIQQNEQVDTQQDDQPDPWELRPDEKWYSEQNASYDNWHDGWYDDKYTDQEDWYDSKLNASF